MVRVRAGIAFVVYLVGTLTCGGIMVDQLARFGGPDFLDWLWTSLQASAVAVAIWWITTGIGIRLGAFPVDFFRAVARTLGLGYEAPVEGATRVPRRPDDESI